MHSGFAPDTTSGVVIIQNQTTTQNFSLFDIAPPVITTTLHASTTDTQGPYDIPVHIEEYSGLTEKTLHYRVGASDWVSVPLSLVSGEDYTASIPGQPYVSEIGYYVTARDAAGLPSVDPPGAPAAMHIFVVAPLAVVADDAMESASGWTADRPRSSRRSTTSRGTWAPRCATGCGSRTSTDPAPGTTGGST